MSWVSANAPLKPYTKLNYTARVNSPTKLSPRLRKISQLRVGDRIGGDTSFGSVRLLGDDGKYVVKRMVFKANRNTDYLKIFLNEVRVGRMPHIAKVGPKIHLWRLIRDSTGEAVAGEYIMDSFTKGNPNLKVFTLSQYFRSSCPARGHPIFGKLRETLFNFWRITQGYHGDLHTSNIAVLVKRDGSIARLLIFDYGAHKRFKETASSSCFEDFVDQIDREFQKRYTKSGASVEFFPPMSTVKTVQPVRGQSFRPNTNLLRAFRPNGNSRPIRHGFNKSIMSHLTGPENITKRFPKNKTAKNLNVRKYTHRNFFVKPNVWKKAVGYARPSNKLVEFFKRVYAGRSTPDIKKAITQAYKRSPENVYNTMKTNFPNVPPNNRRAMFKNLGINVYSPKRPGNRIQHMYKNIIIKSRMMGRSEKNIKNLVLAQLNDNLASGQYINMPTNVFNKMVNNYKKM